MKGSVFIQTNERQLIGAKVSEYLLKRNSRSPESFDVRLVHAEDFPFLSDYDGRKYLRAGKTAIWRKDDLQSFPPLRFTIPKLMGYAGRAVVIDPDVFAVGDISELLGRDMRGAAVLARPMDDTTDEPRRKFASSVMRLDCEKLRHWDAAEQFAELFTCQRDYSDWMWLRYEVPGSVQPLETVWNDFDRLAPDTHLLHNTGMRTQPWKTGLPAEFEGHGNSLVSRGKRLLRRARSTLSGSDAPYGYYAPHPDPAQERFFFRALGECLDKGVIDKGLLREQIARRYVRPDAFTCVDAARG